MSVTTPKDSDWLVKIRRYDGSTSVLGRFAEWDEAQNYASELNRHVQAKIHYVEAYDEGKS